MNYSSSSSNSTCNLAYLLFGILGVLFLQLIVSMTTMEATHTVNEAFASDTLELASHTACSALDFLHSPIFSSSLTSDDAKEIVDSLLENEKKEEKRGRVEGVQRKHEEEGKSHHHQHQHHHHHHHHDPTTASPSSSAASSSSSSSSSSSTSSVSKKTSLLRYLKNAALVVMAYNRPKHLIRTLRSIQRAAFFDSFDGRRFISIDGRDPATVNAAKSFGDHFELLHHSRDPPPPGLGPTFTLAAHYEFVFNKVFTEKKIRKQNKAAAAAVGGGGGGNGGAGKSENENDNGENSSGEYFSHLILFEDDMDVGNDIFAYFESYAPVLDDDPTVWCVSSWNDNAFSPPFFLPKHKAFRTSYFPGLGWMMKRSLWVDDLSRRWPRDNWDHWMRVSATSKQRSCIVPFVSRNFNFGDQGGSTGSDDFYSKYMSRVTTTGSKVEKFSSHFSSSSSSSPSAILDSLKHFGDDMRTEAAYDEWLQSELAKGIVVNIAQLNFYIERYKNHKKSENQQVKKNQQSEDEDDDDKKKDKKNIIVPYLSEEFEARIADILTVHPFPRTHYKFVTWYPLSSDTNLFLIDRRQSPFATEKTRKVLPADSLEPVAASGPGISCDSACENHKSPGSFKCDATQFDFINSCDVLADYFTGCACQQGWGEDIPNMEAASIHHPPPANCLVTEMTPKCAASHPLTTRLCPCVAA